MKIVFLFLFIAFQSKLMVKKTLKENNPKERSLMNKAEKLDYKEME